VIAAALTILRAHIVAGSPGARELSPFGSFEQWSEWVRGALVWLGEADPCRTRKYVQADDPAYEAAASLFAAIHADRQCRGQLHVRTILCGLARIVG